MATWPRSVRAEWGRGRYVGHLWQDLVGRYSVGVDGRSSHWARRSRDEGHAHAAFVMRPFLAAQWRRAGDRVLVPERGVRAVVTEEDHQRVLHRVFKMIEHVIERFVHAPINVAKA